MKIFNYVYVFVFCFLSSSALAAEFQGLGFPPDADLYSRVRDISDDGTVVVGIAQNRYWIPSFIWTEQNGMQVFGDPIPGLPPPWENYTISLAYNVSGDGNTVMGTVAFDFSDLNTPVTWSEQSGYTVLPLNHNLLRDLSYNGEYVAAAHHTGLGTEAVRWSAAGGIEVLGSLTLPGYSPTSYAEAISADGSVVVGYGTIISDGRYVPFRWTEAGGMVSLGHLPGETRSYARAVSADGNIVAGESGPKIFRWTQATGMVSLGTLEINNSLYSSSTATDISNDGNTIVGSSYINFGGGITRSYAIVWQATGGIRTLEDILVNDYAIDLQGWQLNYAVGVSADGLTIVGVGKNPSGVDEPWRIKLDPPVN